MEQDLEGLQASEVAVVTPSPRTRNQSGAPAQPSPNLLASFVYNEEYQIFICRLCGFAVAPGIGVRRHLERHHLSWPLPQRRAVEEHAGRLSLASSKTILSPLPIKDNGTITAIIEGLSIQAGWKCQQCGHLNISEASIREHCRSTHQWIKAKGRQWTAAKVQTIFPSRLRRFFEVVGETQAARRRGNGDATAIEDAAERRLAAHQARQGELRRQAAVLPSEVSLEDLSPWLRKTRWGKKFAGRRLGDVATLAQRPGADEGSLRLVWQSVERVLQRCKESVSAWHEEEEDGDVVLNWLDSPRADRCNPQPFNAYYQATTHRNSVACWAQLLCYLLRLVHAEDRHSYQFIASEEEALREIWDLLELGACEDAGEAQADLDRLVREFSVQLWMQQTRAEARSAIIHFTAVLGIDRAKGSFRTPTSYSPQLPPLLYCARLLLFEHALPAARRRDIENPCGRFVELHHRWLVDGEPTPFHYVDNLLAYALGAGKEVGGRPCVTWSSDKRTLIYRGQRVPLAQLRRLVDELCTVAETLLAKDLLFLPQASPESWQMDLRSLVDDMTETAAGYGFVTEARNKLGDRAPQAFRRLIADAKARSLLKVEGGELRVKVQAWRTYLGHLDRFRTLLFLLVHICGGAPARGPEILGVRYVNVAQAPRNVFVHDGQVAIVTAYHKSQSITNQHRVIARFLPSRVSQLLVAHVTLVLPLRALLEPPFDSTAVTGYVWEEPTGPWRTPRASQALAAETTERLGVRLKILDWRHVAKAIDREYIRTAVRTRDAGEESDGEEEEWEEGEMGAFDLAAGHSSRTADQIYGLDATMLRSLSARTLAAFQSVSTRWHGFWGLNSRQHGESRKRSADDTQASNKRLCGADDSITSSDVLQAGLERLLGPSTQFRSVEQEAAAREIQKGISPLVVVLPPGAGKTLLFQLPASLSDAQTTVVVVPYRALVGDLARRCRSLGLMCSTWQGSGDSPAARLVFVSAETAACNDDFYTFLGRLQSQGRLDRIVVDECHLPLTAAHYRHQLVHLDRLRSIPCPLLLLTGTLPPVLQSQLEHTFLLGSEAQGLRYIRASTDRANIEYRVEVRRGKADAEGRVKGLVREACAAQGPRTRCLVFCRSRAECEDIASQLGCQAYHRTIDDREETLAAWADGEEQVIVATSALSAGVDIANIELVVHLSRPHGIVDFVQEVGRGGRACEATARSVVVLSQREFGWLRSPSSEEREYNQEAMRLYLTEEGCRRRYLTGVMDGHGVACEDVAGSQRCDCCQRASAVQKVVDVGQSIPATQADERDREAEEQAQRYASGPQLWSQRVQTQGRERREIEEAVQAVGDGCAACWLRGGVSPAHHVAECRWLEEVLEEKYVDVRRRMQLEKRCFCCYRCGLPADWCPDYSQKQRCRQKDVILPLALAMWGTPAGRTWLAREARGESIEAVVKWVGEATRVGGSRASNAVYAANQAIRGRAASEALEERS